jgi:hypothetical protein
LKRTIWRLILTGLLTLGAQAGFAQESEGEGDYATDSGGDSGGGYDTSTRHSSGVSNVISNQSFSFYLDTYGYRFSNGDLRRTDNSSFLTVDYTEDELLLACMNVGFYFSATILDYFDFNFEMNKPGFWGNDSLSSATKENVVYTRALNFDVNAGKAIFGWDANELSVVVGRQDFEFCEDSSHNEYVFDDTIDAVKLHCYFPSIYVGLDALVDFYSMNSPADPVYSISAAQHDYTVDNFNGDVNIIRFAFVPKFFYQDDSEDALIRLEDARLYYLFADIGATGEGDLDSGGYEMTGIGTSGNFADNDWVMIFGLSSYTKLSFLSAYLEAAYSIGKDVKPWASRRGHVGLLAQLSLDR